MTDQIVGQGSAISRLTASDMVALGIKSLGNPSENDWDENDQLVALNLAVMAIVSAKPGRFPQFQTEVSISTVASTKDYELSQDVIRIDNIGSTTIGMTPPVLEKRDMDWYAKEGVFLSTGAPYFWIDREWGSTGKYQYRLCPTPNAVYSLVAYVVAIPSRMTLEVPTFSQLPQIYDQTLLMESIEIALALISRRDEVAAQKAIVESSKEKARGGRPRMSEKLWKLASSFSRAMS